MGSVVRDSDILTCISLKENGAKPTVSTTYAVAIISPCATKKEDALRFMDTHTPITRCLLYTDSKMPGAKTLYHKHNAYRI